MAFVKWCHLKGLITQHAANEIGGSIGAMKAKAIKNKRMGTTAGFPDLLIFIPIRNTIDHDVDSYQIVAIEMKRKKGGRLSPEQRQWLDIFEMAGIPNRVCKGASEAISYIETIMQDIVSYYPGSEV